MSDLSQFKNMPREPQLWDIEKTEQDNAEYNAPLNVSLEEQKASLMKDLYWVKPKEIEEQKEKPESDSPYFPILKNLFESWHIDEDLFKKTTEKFNKIEEWEELTELLKIVNNLSDNKVKNDILKSFDKKEETTEKNFNKTEFFKDSTALNIDLDKWVGWLEIMLADNYVSINNKDWTENKQRDLSSSMDTTMNIILRNSSTDFLKQNGPLITEIKQEKNLEKKYSLLKDLYMEDLKIDATFWWKKAKDEINRKKTSLIEEAKNITLKIKEAEKITDKWEKEKTLKKLNDEKQVIINEWKWIDNFEAEVEELAWWKIDKWSEEVESKIKTD